MKEITVISGKGGTGKTTITGAFAALAENIVLADCDVDASNLHLVLNPKIKKKENFSGSQIAIKKPGCIECGICEEVCRFDAVSDDYEINELKCEGCGTCVYVCPEDVLEMKEIMTGEVYSSDTRFGPLIHAELGIGEEASGKLVSKVKEWAKNKAKEKDSDLILVDGSPGIGCPVIASISGSDLVLIVTEPTLAGIHDFERVYQMTQHFDVQSCVCINKYDLNKSKSEEIERFCKENEIPIVAKLPYDDMVSESIISEETIIEYDKESKISKTIIDMWNKIMNRLNEI